MTSPLSAEQLLEMADTPLTREEADALLHRIDAWCTAYQVPPAAFGQMAVDFGGFVGLLRKRLSARARMAAVVENFLARHPDSSPPDWDAERDQARKLLHAVRGVGPTYASRPVPRGPMIAQVPPVYPAGAPCMWCALKGATGPCNHSTSLADQVRAEAEQTAGRRRIARSTGTVDTVLDLERPAPTAAPSRGPEDTRPFARDRLPCAHCGARGDLGCAHQQPCLPADHLPFAEAAE